MSQAPVLYIAHHMNRYSGNLHEYLRTTRGRFFAFMFCSPHTEAATVFDEFRDGIRIRRKEYFWYTGKRTVLKYVFFYLYFVHAMLFEVPSGTTVITTHPLFCVGNSLLERFRRSETILWVLDYFPLRTGLYRWYNALTDLYVRRLKTVLFVTGPIRDAYAHLTPPAGSRREVMELAIAERDAPRSPEPGLFGFIGNLKHGQGVEVAIDACAADPTLRFEIVGDGVTMADLKGRVTRLGVGDRVRFWGTVLEEHEVRDICVRWNAAVAIYEDGQYVRYCDPGKVKLYLEHRIPVIMTRMTHIAPVLEHEAGGEIIPADPHALAAAVHRIERDGARYAPGIGRLVAFYEYKRYFADKLSFLA